MLSYDFSTVLIIFTCRLCGHIDEMTKENIDEKLINYLTDHFDENPIDFLDDSKYLEKIESKINNYVNLYVICEDTILTG